jgi:hypothetical protein
MRSALLAALLALAACSKSDDQCTTAACADAGVTLAEIGDPCTGNVTCASGLCDLSYPEGLCYALCHADADCGDLTMKLCGADGRCYLACRSAVDCEPGAATCVADAPARADGQMLCRGVPSPPADAAATDAPLAPPLDAPPEASPADASGDSE